MKFLPYLLKHLRRNLAKLWNSFIEPDMRINKEFRHASVRNLQERMLEFFDRDGNLRTPSLQEIVFGFRIEVCVDNAAVQFKWVAAPGEQV